MEHTRESRPDSGLISEVKVLKTFQVVSSLLGSGIGKLLDRAVLGALGTTVVDTVC